MRDIRRLFAALLALVLLMSLAACGGEKKKDNTLVYGSGDYTRINPAMDEHGEINILIFNGLTAHDGENQVVGARLGIEPANELLSHGDWALCALEEFKVLDDSEGECTRGVAKAINEIAVDGFGFA